ncbi:MAG: hypothetical protein HC895_13840 [Leptolyngbyaceae cyanobacterium SM1_3_5]|nr:hypothetical protein [Leptolyngbyaceae cyanobacterium SM1_3_5]
MLRHHELYGDELHNARISIEPPTRSPAFIGETVFDGAILWIATGITADTWTASHQNPAPPQIPPFFSWSLDLSPIRLGHDAFIAIYFSRYSFETRNWSAPELIKQFRLGGELPAFDGILNLNYWIELFGVGRYLPLVRQFDRARVTDIAIDAVSPAGAAAIVNLGRFVEPGTSLIHSNARAIEISKCQAGFAGRLLTPQG